MLLKLSFKNIRHSLRDYSVYFFTLIIGVMVFYAFNAISGQTAMFELTGELGRTVDLLQGALTGVSVLVAAILGLLIVYASRFLMKRRNKEFALYLLLGMEKGKISALLFWETIIIGIGSLAAGLLLGIGLSQIMSAFVMNLFMADMTAYQFSISSGAIAKTILCFAVMYLIVMLFNGSSVTRMKLIDLLHSGKKSEKVKLKNPVLCILVFVLGAAMLGLVYYMAGWHSRELSGSALGVYIIVTFIATLLVFWSVSGLLLRIIMSMKKIYYRGLNSFTFRQLSSKVNTVVFSMTIICMMLFLTICMLASAFSIRNNMNANINRCPADFEIRHKEILPERGSSGAFDDIVERYAQYGYDLPVHFADYVHFHSYADPSFRWETAFAMTEELMILDEGVPGIFRISDYNALMKLYGREELRLADDEFIVLCDYDANNKIFDKYLNENPAITIFDHTLHAASPETQVGFLEIKTAGSNTGVLLIPDSVAEESAACVDYFIGNYRADTEEERQIVEKQCRTERDVVEQRMDADWENGLIQTSYYTRLETKIEIVDNSIGMGTLITIIGLYLGMIFLVSSGAILALRELSDSVDSSPRYEILRKIGAEESDISRSLFHQTGIFFLLPLIIAGIHSVFGMKFTITYISLLGTEGMAASIAATLIIILLIYGGYFVITYLGCRGIIKGK